MAFNSKRSFLWHPVPQVLRHLLLPFFLLMMLMTGHLKAVYRESTDRLIEQTDAEFQTAHHQELVILKHCNLGRRVQKVHADVCHFGMRAEADLWSWFNWVEKNKNMSTFEYFISQWIFFLADLIAYLSFFSISLIYIVMYA